MEEEDSPFLLPRRSHLRSTTIRTLVRILSHCIDDFSDSPSQIASETPKPGTKDSNFLTNSSDFLETELSRHGNLKSSNAQNEIFGNEIAFSNESVEFENVSVEKDPISDGNPMKIGNGNGESVDCDNKLEFDKISFGKDQIVNENPNLSDTQKVVVCGVGLIDMELGKMVQEKGSGESFSCSNVEFENLSVEKEKEKEKDPIADGIPEGMHKITGREMIDGTFDNGEFKIERLSKEKDPITDGNPMRTSNRDVGSCLGESFVDRGSEQGEGSDEVVGCNAVESEHLSIKKDPIVDGSPKLIDAQSKVFGGQGSSVDWELGEVMQEKGTDESVDLDKLEIESLSMEKDLITHGNPVPIHPQDELICGGRSPVDGGLGLIVGQRGNGESVYCGKLELENLSTEKRPTADGSPKPTNNKDGHFCDGGRLVGRELGHAMQKEGRDEFKNYSLEKDPVADGILEAVQLGQGTQQEEHNGFIVHEGLKGSISSVQKGLIVENICTSFDTQDCYNGSEQNAREFIPHEMQPEGHELNTLYPSDTNANSSRLRNMGEVAIIDNVNDSAILIADQEMEDGEIPFDSGGPMESHNSVLEHVVYEERKSKEGKIADGLTKQGEDFAHTFKEQLRVDKKDMFLGSDLAGTFISMENCIGRNLKEKEIKGIKDDSKKPGSSKTNNVKWPFRNDSMKTPKMKARENRVEGDATCQLNTSDCLGLPGEDSEEIGAEDQGKIFIVKDSKVREKKKRASISEERKSKKKLAKKRKRAEQNKKLGVKRLKLQPILKPKVVSDCVFHLKGKCQQGDKCKFSHDAVPLTKSQPCRHLVKHSCLKGDDCPFDHQLSKYPCYNYMSRGVCTRGDACQFSHQMPIAEGVSGASKFCSPGSMLSPDKASSKKQLNFNATSNMVAHHVLKDTSLSTPSPLQSLLHKHVGPKLLTHAPEGIRFLSFGKAPLDDTNKNQQNNLPSNKCNGFEACNQQKQTESEKLVNINEMPCRLLGSSLSSCQPFKSSSCGPKNAPTSAQRAHLFMPAVVGKYDSDIIAKQSVHASLNAGTSNILESSSISREFATQSHAEKSQSRSTDASMILEEFLFSGIE